MGRAYHRGDRRVIFAKLRAWARRTQMPVCTGAEALRELNTRGLARWHKSIYQLTQRARGVFTGGLRAVVRGTDLQSPSGMGTREKMAETAKPKPPWASCPA